MAVWSVELTRKFTSDMMYWGYIKIVCECVSVAKLYLFFLVWIGWGQSSCKINYNILCYICAGFNSRAISTANQHTQLRAKAQTKRNESSILLVDLFGGSHFCSARWVLMMMMIYLPNVYLCEVCVRLLKACQGNANDNSCWGKQLHQFVGSATSLVVEILVLQLERQDQCTY